MVSSTAVKRYFLAAGAVLAVATATTLPAIADGTRTEAKTPAVQDLIGGTPAADEVGIFSIGP